MAWPFRLKRFRRRMQAARKAMNIAEATPRGGVSGVSDTTGGLASDGAFGAAVASYVCHYCERTDGSQTRDHKLPRMFGGTGLQGTIARCCLMCNIIKGARPLSVRGVLRTIP